MYCLCTFVYYILSKKYVQSTRTLTPTFRENPVRRCFVGARFHQYQGLRYIDQEKQRYQKSVQRARGVLQGKVRVLSLGPWHKNV